MPPRKLAEVYELRPPPHAFRLPLDFDEDAEHDAEVYELRPGPYDQRLPLDEGQEAER